MAAAVAVGGKLKTMITPQYVALMARYNRWMNDKLFAASELLTDEQHKSDRRAFFKSIHLTLNHLMWGDYTWLGRFTKDTPLEKAYPKVAFGTELFPDWQALKSERLNLDADICAWAERIDVAWLERDFSWHSGLTKSTRTKPAWQLVMHFFNHQTHHRGQVTTLLSQYGVDPGDTDLMLMPE